LAGSIVIPIVRFDPAIASGPLLTTVTVIIPTSCAGHREPGVVGDIVIAAIPLRAHPGLLAVASAVATLALVSACASVESLERPYPVGLPMPPDVAGRFDYDAGPVRAELTLLRENVVYRLFEGEFLPDIAGSDDDSPISFEYYEQKGENRAPVVLVLPILNGQKHVVRPFASHFVANGYNAVIVDTLQRKTLLEDMLEPEAAIRRTAVRHRRVLDWIETVPQIDSEKLAVFGASLGGFNALFLTAADDRVRASALALVAGDLPFVLTNSSESRIIAAADGAMETLQTDREGLRHYLEEQIESDPLALARFVDPERVLLVLARFDDAVHYEKQLALRDAMGNPESITLPTGHVTTAAYLFYLRGRVQEFFDRQFSGVEPQLAGIESESDPGDGSPGSRP
jgi:pimeloyl-ACP methyl ester carboxylesterase